MDYYPSITKEIFENAIKWARQYTEISDSDIELFHQTKKSLLYCDGEIWTKKENSQFDNAMGGYDSAEVCDLVGLYLLSKFNTLDIEAGLYRDDGLATYQNIPPSAIDKMRKDLHALFAKYKLRITVEHNIKMVDFLDVTFDLQNGSFAPFRKPNDIPLYIHADSNHPETVLKQVPKTINKRLNSISSSKEQFEKAIPEYQCALDKSKFPFTLCYTEKNYRH